MGLAYATFLNSTDGYVAVGSIARQGSPAGHLVVKYTERGALDTGFAERGARYGAHAGRLDHAAVSNGSIVAAGAAGGDFALLRLDAAGRPDQAMGEGGLARVDLGAADALLLRYNPDGSPDLSFGDGGAVVTDAGDSETLLTLAVLPDGRIARGGWSLGRGLLFARYRADGAPDPSFDGDGLMTLQLGGNQAVWALAVDGDGLLAAACPAEQSHDGLLLRLTAGGALDPSFGEAGRVAPSFSGRECLPALAVGERRVAAAGVACGIARTYAEAVDMAVMVWERAAAPAPAPSPAPGGREHRLFLPLLGRGS